MKNFTRFIIIALASSISTVSIAKEAQTEQQINEQMQQMATKINNQLPRKVDEMMTLLHIDYDNKVFSYFYKIDDLSQLKNTANVEANMTRIACSSMSKMINDLGYSYRYNYVAPNNEQIMDFTVNKDSCTKLTK